MTIILLHIDSKFTLSPNWMYNSMGSDGKFINGMKVIMMVRQRRFRDRLEDRQIIISKQNTFYSI